MTTQSNQSFPNFLSAFKLSILDHSDFILVLEHSVTSYLLEDNMLSQLKYIDEMLVTLGIVLLCLNRIFLHLEMI